MATSGPVIECIASATGKSPRTVRSKSQALRDGGALRMNGRGGSAHHWTITDAINVFIAVCAAESRADAVATVQRLRDAQIDEPMTVDQPAADLLREHDAALAEKIALSAALKARNDELTEGLRTPRARTAGEALEGLLADVQERKIGCFVNLEFRDRSAIDVCFIDPSRGRYAGYLFRVPDAPQPTVSNIVRIENAYSVLKAIGDVLGPPE